MDSQLPIMGPHEDPDKPQYNPNDPSAPKRAPFAYFNFELEDELRKERQAKEPRLRQETQDALEMYDLAVEQFQTPDHVVIYEAPRCGDMALFLAAIRRNKALAPHVLHVAFTDGLDDLKNCGIVQRYGIGCEYSYSFVPKEIMYRYPHITELKGEETIGIMARDHLRLSVSDDSFLAVTTHIRQVLRRYDDALLVGDAGLAIRTMLEFYGDQWKDCENVRTITLPTQWYDVVAPGGQCFAEYFPNVPTDTSYGYMHEGTEYITVGDDQTQRTQAWTRSVEPSMNFFKARGPGNLAAFVELLYTEGSRVAPRVKHLNSDKEFDRFRASGLPKLLAFEDWQNPRYRQPLDLDQFQFHSEALNAANTPIEHPKVNIRLVPSLFYNDNPFISPDRVLGSIVADLFSCCTNLCSLILPNEWLDVSVEAHESLFPLVDWTKQQAFPTEDRTYVGDPKLFYDTMGADKERVLDVG